ncbi:MAG: hypothetical protein QOH76_197, partial [Thermoleophilaceae bacterium]|nr:hypothetical protein [Thermoleophilaceae bacterium]
GPHHLQIADFSTGRKFRRVERLAFRRATTDPAVARAAGEVLTRERSAFHLLDPRIGARVLVPRGRARSSAEREGFEPSRQGKPAHAISSRAP